MPTLEQFELQGKRGFQTLGAGSNGPLRQDASGALVSGASGRFYDQVASGKVFTGANLGGTPVTTQAGLSATTPALTLYNPSGSGVNLSLLTFGYAFQASPAAAVEVWLAANLVTAAAPSSVTNSTVTSALVGSSGKGQGQCYIVATLAAAPLVVGCFGGTSGALAIGGVATFFNIDGSIVVPPGGCLSVQTSTAAALTASFTWAEVVV